MQSLLSLYSLAKDNTTRATAYFLKFEKKIKKKKNISIMICFIFFSSFFILRITIAKEPEKKQLIAKKLF